MGKYNNFAFITLFEYYHTNHAYFKYENYIELDLLKLEYFKPIS